MGDVIQLRDYNPKIKEPPKQENMQEELTRLACEIMGLATPAPFVAHEKDPA